MEEILDYEGLIYSIIKKYSSKYDSEDLFQVGMIGLLDAYHHYDEKYDTKFSTYAYYYIIGEVNKYIRENSGIKISKNIIELNKKIIKAREMLEQKLNRKVGDQELSEYLGIDIEQIQQAIIATGATKYIEDDNIDTVYLEKNTSAEIMDLHNEIDKLCEEDKKIILARYYEELTQSETSNKLGISQVQVSRKESKILKKLKTRL